MRELTVFYAEGAWNRVHIPEEGSVILYPSGLLNVMDRHGRCVSATSGRVIGVLDLSGAVKDFQGKALPHPDNISRDIAEIFHSWRESGPTLDVEGG